jgi:hypothetical protein
MTPERMQAEGLQITPESIFSSCPNSQIAMIFGVKDNYESLIFHKDRIPEKCLAGIDWY